MITKEETVKRDQLISEFEELEHQWKLEEKIAIDRKRVSDTTKSMMFWLRLAGYSFLFVGIVAIYKLISFLLIG